MESQRARIVKNITEREIDDVIKYEKLLLDVDAKINNIIIRINAVNSEPKKEIGEEVIKDFVLYILVKHKGWKINQEQITSEIINIRQCSVKETEEIHKQSY